MKQRTKDGLPVVVEKTFMEFIKKYPTASTNNDPEITRRIKSENPQIYHILLIGMEHAPHIAARAYYECGIQIIYELFRRQSIANKKK